MQAAGGASPAGAPHPPYQWHSAAAAHPQGYLLPVYHQYYWFGLNTSDGSTWNQLDRTISNTFKGWGVFKPGPGQQPTREPNNLFDPEYCAGCNYTELVTGKFSVWGWGDEQCGQLHPVMCRSTGAYLMALAAAAC